MKAKNFASYHIRKWYSFTEETHANETGKLADGEPVFKYCLLYTSPSPRDVEESRMPSSA